MKDDKVLLDAFESYSNDLSEMIYQHLDVINEKYKEQWKNNHHKNKK